MIIKNLNSTVLTYGQSMLGKSANLFETAESIFSEWISFLFLVIDQKERNDDFQTGNKNSIGKIRGISTKESNFKVYLSSYQIINEEVVKEVSWERCMNMIECNKWRRNNLEKYTKINNSHIIVSIKVHDEIKNKDSELTFIDIADFDRSFTDKIMNGETDVNFDQDISDHNGKNSV